MFNKQCYTYAAKELFLINSGTILELSFNLAVNADNTELQCNLDSAGVTALKEMDFGMWSPVMQKLQMTTTESAIHISLAED